MAAAVQPGLQRLGGRSPVPICRTLLPRRPRRRCDISWKLVRHFQRMSPPARDRWPICTRLIDTVDYQAELRRQLR